MRRRRKGQSEELPIGSGSKAGSAICRLRCSVFVTYLDRDCPYTGRLTETPHLKQRSRTEALVATGRLDIEIVQTSDNATELHRIFESQHEISNFMTFLLNNPRVAQALIAENGGKCAGRALTVEFVARFSIEGSH